MPHLIIEYAAPLKDEIDIQKLVEDAFAGAEESDLFDPVDIKVRATPVEDYSTGGTDQAFVHIDIKLLPGRTTAQKKDLAERVLNKVAAIVKNDVAISVEINTLDGDTYTKRA